MSVQLNRCTCILLTKNIYFLFIIYIFLNHCSYKKQPLEVASEMIARCTKKGLCLLSK